MTLLFRITLIVCALLVFIYVLRKIRHSEVKIADSTFWFIFALVIVILAVFPHIAFFFSNILGIESPSNCVFLAIIAILLVREFFTTVELSQLRNKVAALAQAEALAELDAIENADAGAGANVGAGAAENATASTPASVTTSTPASEGAGEN